MNLRQVILLGALLVVTYADGGLDQNDNEMAEAADAEIDRAKKSALEV